MFTHCFQPSHQRRLGGFTTITQFLGLIAIHESAHTSYNIALLNTSQLARSLFVDALDQSAYMIQNFPVPICSLKASEIQRLRHGTVSPYTCIIAFILAGRDRSLRCTRCSVPVSLSLFRRLYVIDKYRFVLHIRLIPSASSSS